MTTSDGVCEHLFGPDAGRCHDMFFYGEFNEENFLRELLRIEEKKYVDSAGLDIL